jgi:hypothetical protein
MELMDLKAGEQIRVTQEFLDFDGDKIEVGSLWTFKEYKYFAYDGGYTFYFEEGGIRLAELEESNREVLCSFSSFFDLVN